MVVILMPLAQEIGVVQSMGVLRLAWEDEGKNGHANGGLDIQKLHDEVCSGCAQAGVLCVGLTL